MTIASKVWMGGNAITLPGVTIGHITTVGPGSVVNRDRPPRDIAAGNLSRVLREA